MSLEVHTPSGKDISGIIELTTIIVVLSIMGYFAYWFLDSKGKELKTKQVKHKPVVVNMIDSKGKLYPVSEYCVNGVVYFGSPMVLLRDRDDKVVPCSWEAKAEEKK